MSTIAQAIQAQRANKENTFYSSLMQYAMEGSGMPLPDKSVLWNRFVQLKGGRMTPQDIAQFESVYTQVRGAKYGQQMAEYQRMSLAGMSDRDIRQSIKDDPIKYKNLLDMITKLKQSGNVEDAGLAAQAEDYLPQDTMFEKMAKGDVGLMARIGGPLLAGGAVTGLQYLAGRDVTDINKQIKTKTSKLKDLTKKIDKTLKTSPSKTVPMTNEYTKLSKEVEDLKNQKSKAPRRYKKYTSKIPKGGLGPSIAGYGLLSSLPAAGEYFGGEEGRGVGETAADIGLLTMAGRTLMGLPTAGLVGVLTKLAGAGLLGIPAAQRMYQDYFGDEE